MKYILKGREPQEFSDWKALENENWKPTYDDLSGIPKIAIKKSLMTEQGFICCYCERELTDRDSHIEHFKPRTQFQKDSLDYANMLCSCQNNLKKGEPRHCGTLKDEWFDERLLVSPFDENCVSRFRFIGNGEIYPADASDSAARITIKKLGLDIRKLNALRKAAIDEFLEELGEREVTEFVSGYLKQDSQGKFTEFWTTIRYLYALPGNVEGT